MSPWRKFVPRRSPKKMEGVVSVRPTGLTVAEDLSNRHFNIEEYVELYFNEEEGLVGIKPSDDGYRIRTAKNSLAIQIQAASFVKKYRLARGRYEAKWDADEEMLVFEPDFEEAED